MSKYEFLLSCCNELDPADYWDCQFAPALSFEEIDNLEARSGITVPAELKDFYQFSYGARLCEYKILTLDEIADTLKELIEVYGVYNRSSLLPFASVLGVGDYVALDLALAQDGELMVVDGFHELGPDEWENICYGLVNWLTKLAKNKFQPFWLGNSE